MNPLEFTQNVYIIVLLVGSIVALFGGSKFIILVMWINLGFTIQYSHAPDVLMVLDLLSACVLVAVVRDKPAMTVAVLFGLMVFSYKLVAPLGFYVTYTIVDVLAYAQIFAMGSTGFGSGIRIIRNRIRKLSASSVHSKETTLDTTADVFVVAGEAQRPRVNG
jgi:hypothetical protein